MVQTDSKCPQGAFQTTSMGRCESRGRGHIFGHVLSSRDLSPTDTPSKLEQARCIPEEEERQQGDREADRLCLKL